MASMKASLALLIGCALATGHLPTGGLILRQAVIGESFFRGRVGRPLIASPSRIRPALRLLDLLEKLTRFALGAKPDLASTSFRRTHLGTFFVSARFTNA
jgi:hypothetical protein